MEKNTGLFQSSIIALFITHFFIDLLYLHDVITVDNNHSKIIIILYKQGRRKKFLPWKMEEIKK